MNLSNQPPAPHRPTDEQLEERIVAWVLGEASAFEVETLQAALAARPELAVFKRRIEAVHGLVSVAARPDAEPLRLSSERRAKLLHSLGVTEPATTPAATTPAAKKPAVRAKSSVLTIPFAKKPPFWQQPWFYSAAACVAFGLILVTVPLSNRYAPQSLVKAIPLELPSTGEDEAYACLPEPIMAESASDSRPSEKEANWAPPAKLGRALNVAPQIERPQVARSSVSSKNASYAATPTRTGSRLNTELKDIGSAVTVVTDEFRQDTGATDAKSALQYFGFGKRNSFLTKRKAEQPAAKLAGKGGAVALPSPAAPRAEEEIVVLSPFEVSKSPDFLKKTPRSSGEKRPKRPNPMATVGMGPGGLKPESLSAGLDQVLQPAQPTASSPSTPSTPSTAPAADKPLPRPTQKPLPPANIEEVSAAQEAVSTFSLHVSDVSFKLALAALAAGTWPDRATIRPEEFYNAFDYGDPATAAAEKISCRIEQAAHPFAQQRNLVRIAMRVPATGRGAGQPLHLTVLLDTSGSMERPDRRATVRAALATLVGLLGPADRLTVIGFARQPRLLAEALDGNHANQALDLLDRTPAEGGTNLEEALNLGGQLARRQFSATAQNRLVLLTDGAANLGNADPDRLSAAIESLRAQRIAFDACGVGLDGLDDTILEALTRKGDGRYYVLNSPESADAGFARQLAGALRPAAENVKVQVRFNPARVGHYRLVGFEKHRLREEDFRNDAVDAAELAAEEAAVAVYEIEAKPQGEGELGEVFVRFRDAATKEMVERSWTLPYEARAAVFDRASPSLQLAGTAAMLAEKIRGGPAGDRVELATLAPIVNALRGRRPDDQRLQELATMFEQLRRLEGK